MENTCHRCHGVLLEALPYCPHCGAPQLTMNSYAQPLASAMEAAEIKAGLRPQPVNAQGKGVDWHAAVRAALLVTAIAVALMAVSSIVPWAFLQSVTVIWMFAAAFFSVGLYHRGSPKALITAGVGAKIGSMVGLLLSAAIVALTGASLFVWRYVMQRGDELTNTIKAHLNESNAQVLQMYKSAGMADQQLAAMKQMTSYFVSPPGLAVMMLLQLAMMTAVLVIFCVVTGAIGGRLLLRRQNVV